VAAYESAVSGDAVAAARAQQVVLRYEALAVVATGGSTNAADLSAMKHVLHLRGVIDHPTVTAPLRPLTDDEITELAVRLQRLDDVAAAAGARSPTQASDGAARRPHLEPVPPRA
jgi:dihydrodipicolinate synthase/N-acetylneuraminate lyase